MCIGLKLKKGLGGGRGVGAILLGTRVSFFFREDRFTKITLDISSSDSEPDSEFGITMTFFFLPFRDTFVGGFA